MPDLIVWCLLSGSGPTYFPLGEIQLTVRHSSQRNKLIVVVHSCRYTAGPPGVPFLQKLQTFFIPCLLSPLLGIWSPSPTMAPTRTSAFTCSLTKEGRAEGKLTPSRGTSTPSMTRRESTSHFVLCVAGWLWLLNLFLTQVWVHRLPHGAPPTNSGCGCKERWRSALQTQRPAGKGKLLLGFLFYTKFHFLSF